MTRLELLEIAKPILFNTEMVRAIRCGTKTVTRRPCKIKINGGNPVTHGLCDIAEYPETNIDGLCANFYDNEHFYKGYAKLPYKVDDILYVRETWVRSELGYFYRADSEKIEIPGLNGTTQFFGKADGLKWHPSIHMPKEAARIFIRVTDVRVERLQDITEEQAIREGIYRITAGLDCEYYTYKSTPKLGEVWDTPVNCFKFKLWDGTIKKSDLDRYGWNANPWVGVITFEKLEVE